jgi:hypothetical protein
LHVCHKRSCDYFALAHFSKPVRDLWKNCHLEGLETLMQSIADNIENGNKNDGVEQAGKEFNPIQMVTCSN